jgi:DNA invertase Pin-like site-specific DNA recombinase
MISLPIGTRHCYDVAMNTSKQKLVGYIRVSTQKQGESGLGLEAQVKAISQHVERGGGELLITYREVETGKRADRPELAKAIAHARRVRGTLVIAKLDRLARNVHFVSGLMESKVDFVACDNPHANRLTIHILAAVAEDEAIKIGERTKSALAAAKARGTLLGSARPGHWAGREAARLEGARRGCAVSAKLRTEKSAEAISGIIPVMKSRRLLGESYEAIARGLNGEGHRTVRGCDWNAMQVKRSLDKLDEQVNSTSASAPGPVDMPDDRHRAVAVPETAAAVL